VGDTHFLEQLLLALAIAAAGVALFARLGLPPIPGFLVMGALVGPGALGLAPSSEAVRSLAEFGVVFLMFEIGLELPLDMLRRAWRTLAAVGALQVTVTLAVVALGAAALGLSGRNALVMGGLVAMSSTALVMRLLAERGETDSPHGQLAVGVLIFQDLCIVPLLVGLPILAGVVTLSPKPLALALGKAGLALGALFVATGFAVPWVLDRLVRLRSRELFSLVAFLLAVGSAVAAEAMGLTLAVGAFCAGIMLGSSPWAHQLTAEIVPLRGVLLGVFFTAIGMLFEPAVALRLWPDVLIYLGAVVVLKAVVVFGVVTLALRRSPRLGLLTGIALAQTGEFSFVLAEEAGGFGLLSPDLQQVFVAGSIMSLLATPFLIQLGPTLAARVSGGGARARGGSEADMVSGEPAQVLLVGFGLTGRTIARVLRAARIRYRGVDTNPENVRAARRAGEPVAYGDATRPAMLHHLGVEQARLVAIAISDPFATRAVVSHVRVIAPKARIVVRTRYVAEVDTLYRAGASAVIAEEFEATLDMMGAVAKAAGVSGEAVARVADQLREEGYEALRAPATVLADPWFADLLADAATEWVDVPAGPASGRSLSELEVRARTGVSVVALRRGGDTDVNPAPDRRLAEGDRLLVLGSPDALVRLRELLGTPA
jgi:CPA2 family monovalent cation:H+ antiporter-2